MAFGFGEKVTQKSTVVYSRASLATQNIFLTGATGVLGGHLLKELLRSTDSTIYCLVRADSLQHADERLLGFLYTYDPSKKLEAAYRQRVRPVLGDLVQPKFGLEDEAYLDLARTIDVTVHCAALTNLFLNFKRIEPINVVGTQNIIRFCLKTWQKYLCHVSTHTVMGDKTFDASIRFKEDQLDIGQGFEHMTYQQTKFIAEQLVREASKDGLVWNIMRPGQIFGEAKTGYYPQGQGNIIGLFYDIFKTVIDTRTSLTSSTQFDVVPVDYVSQAVIYLGLQRKSFFETYHLTNPDVKTYSEVIGLLKKLGYPVTMVSQDEYKRRLFEREMFMNGSEYKSYTTSAFKWWFKREIFDFQQGAVTDATYTAKALEEKRILCPPLDVNLIRTYIEAGIKTNYFPLIPQKGTGAAMEDDVKATAEI
jgi:thioester reductase-like protein